MKVRALIFDDDEGVRSVILALSKNRGYEVYDFPSAHSCPVLLQQDCPCPKGYTCADIIITDIKMPGMTGLEFLRNQLSHGCTVPNFAVISGDWTDALKAEAEELGCKIFNKPFALADISAWLDVCEERIDQSRKLWDWFTHGGKSTSGTR